MPVTIPPHRDSHVGRIGGVAFPVLAAGRQKGHSAPDSKGLAHRRPWRQPLVIVPTPFRRMAGVVLGAASLLLPASVVAQGAAPDSAQISTYVPSAHELSRLSPSGSYLAARHAGTNRDAGAAAAYYRASRRGDPKSAEILEPAFLLVVGEGDVEEAVR